ncbi:MAG: hypothetical protein ACRCSI_10440 [Eubacterium aggregans]
MLSDRTYTITFIPLDKSQEEIYHYNNRHQAMEHFRYFYNQDSAELYQSITITEYCWKTQMKKVIGLLTFVENIDGMQIKKDWRNWPVGRQSIFEVHDFDGDNITIGKISETYSDHAIMEADDMHLWIDDDFLYMF